MRIDAKKLEAFVAAIFRAEGCSEAESRRIALYLVRANLTGHDSHGVIRVPRYVDWKRDGEFVKDQTPRSWPRATASRWSTAASASARRSARRRCESASRKARNGRRHRSR